MLLGMVIDAVTEFLMSDADLALHVHLTGRVIRSILKRTETRFNEHDTVVDQRMEEAVLICCEAVLTVCVEQTLGDDAAVVLDGHDEVSVLGQMLDGVLAYLLYLIVTVDLFVLFDELTLFVDSLFDIGQLALDHLDPFHIDNTVIRIT